MLVLIPLKCLFSHLQIDQDTNDLLRSLNMVNLPGVKMVPVSSSLACCYAAMLMARNVMNMGVLCTCVSFASLGKFPSAVLSVCAYACLHHTLCLSTVHKLRTA